MVASPKSPQVDASTSTCSCPLCEAVMAESGLTDVFRLFHGEGARQYTRLGDTVHTRLDRLYAKRYESDWRWTSYTHDFASFGKSDHAAIVAELMTAPKRESTRTEQRIDPAIMRDSRVRADVVKLWAQAYQERPPERFTHAVTWTHARTTVAEYLLCQTEEHRRKSQSKSKLAEINLQRLCEHNDGPSPVFNALKKAYVTDLQEARREEKQERKQSAWSAYMFSLHEEVSSKAFFRRFKAKHSSPDIAALSVTPDWDDPDTKSPLPTKSHDEIREELTKYYKHLFRKEDITNPEPMLRKLRERQIAKTTKDALEKELDSDEIRKAIRNMARGKAPGPDGLGAEFYMEFEDLIAEDLTNMLNEAHEVGYLPEAVRQGDIIVLFKKDNPLEVRNYRPITLLCVDYKIMSKALVARMKPVMDEIVSSPQLGFVPGRVITEATHLVDLAMALADEEAAEGILVAADWEKAFDRVSWDYLHEAVRALGFGPQFCEWIRMIYNEHQPPMRCVKANGERGTPFAIKRGTPQGCPCSPLIFLIVAEALTRSIQDDGGLEGITIANRTVKLSQFADDTQFLLRNYDELPRMWAHIQRYEDATGMRANKKKFEGLRMGHTKRIPVPQNEMTEPIAFVHKGESIKILGVPFFEEYDMNIFWSKLYNKTKQIIAAWKDAKFVTQTGRAMLANTMIVSRYRYWLQSRSPPNWFVEDVDSDIQELVWAKDPTFTAGEAGSENKFKRWMKEGAQCNDRRTGLGIGLLDWPSHVKALQLKWILNYRDGTQGDWKFLLDAWFARTYTEHRGAPFTSIQIKDLTKSTTGRHSALPRFWRQALETLRDLGIHKAHPRRWTANDARAHPIWTSPLFDIRHRRFVTVWRKLELNTLKDAVKPGGEPYTDVEILEGYLDQKYEVSSRGDYLIRGYTPVKRETMRKDWHAILKDIPTPLLRAVQEEQGECWRYSEQSVNMMRSLGWRVGQGIGARMQGRSEPIPAGKGRGGEQREGLGYVATKDTGLPPGAMVKETSKSKPGAQACHVKSEERDKLRGVVCRDDSIIYGYPCSEGMQRAELTVKGLPRRTDEIIDVDKEDMREVVRWNGRVMGIAESTFPHPQEWCLGNMDIPLNKAGVRSLTKAIGEPYRVEPSCVRAWESRIGALPSDLGSRYNNAFLSPKDWHSHFKNVTHRAMFVRSHGNGDPGCRCCKHARESLVHWATCDVVGDIFEAFAKVAGLPTGSWTSETRERWALFAIPPSGEKLKDGLINLHLLVWKYLIALLTRMETEDEAYEPHKVWQAAWSKFKQKALAKSEAARTELLRAESRGKEKPTLEKKSKCMAPMVELDTDGELVWDDNFTATMEKLAETPVKPKKKKK